MTPVKSSTIESIGHDATSRILKVRFKTGRTYHYHGVSADEHAKLMKADSIGAHFSANIRDKFRSTRA